MYAWRCVIAVGIGLALLAPVSAQTLQPHEIYNLTKSSLVFFRSKAKNDAMSYGVVISTQGHVLTAKHVVDAFGGEAVLARIGSNEKTDRLYGFEDEVVAIPDLDVRLLKLKELPPNLRPAPVGKADHFKEATTKVQILTGFSNETNATPLWATAMSPIGSQPDFWRMQGAGIDKGHSGSPAFDQFGNVVGFIPSGFAGTGAFDLRTLDRVIGWLKDKNIPIAERTRPNKFAVYVRTTQREQQRGQLQSKLARIIERWAGVKRAAQESDPPFMKDVAARWDDVDGDLLGKAITRHARSWVESQDARILYLYVIELDFSAETNEPFFAKQRLVMLESDAGQIRAEMMKLNDATNLGASRAQAGDDADEKLAFALVRAAAETENTPFHENGIVMAECLGTRALPTTLASEVEAWKGRAAEKLKEELGKGWHDHPVYHRYRLASSNSETCSERDMGAFIPFDPIGKAKIELEHQHKKEMAELVIEPWIKAVEPPDMLSIQWRLLKMHSNRRRDADGLSRVRLAGDDFASGLAQSIRKSWDDMLDQLKHAD